MRDILHKAYIDYLNDYLTIEIWADHNGMTIAQAKIFMELARHIAETDHPDK